MSKLSKETYKKLVLVYLISTFEKGIYGNYKFQKTLYYGLRDTKNKPFLYEHTDSGMFSQDAWNFIDSIHAAGIIFDVNNNPQSRHWRITDNYSVNELRDVFEKSDPELAQSLRKSVKDYGKLNWRKLKVIVENDPILDEIPEGDVIFDSNLPELVEIDLTEDDSEDLELALNPYFIKAMTALVNNIESGELILGNLSVEV